MQRRDTDLQFFEIASSFRRIICFFHRGDRVLVSTQGDVMLSAFNVYQVNLVTRSGLYLHLFLFLPLSRIHTDSYDFTSFSASRQSHGIITGCNVDYGRVQPRSCTINSP